RTFETDRTAICVVEFFEVFASCTDCVYRSVSPIQMSYQRRIGRRSFSRQYASRRQQTVFPCALQHSSAFVPTVCISFATCSSALHILSSPCLSVYRRRKYYCSTRQYS